MIFKAIDEIRFKNHVDIRFSNITYGLNNYYNGILEINEDETLEENEKKIINFFEKVVELNGEENSFVDFFYSTLCLEDRKNFEKLLIGEDREFFKKVKKENLHGIYFHLSKEMIPFIVRLCTREVLFSTFYFTKIPCTIWGNYNIKLPLLLITLYIARGYFKTSKIRQK